MIYAFFSICFMCLLIVGIVTETHFYIFAIGILILIEIMIKNLKEILREINIDKRNI